MAAGEFRKRYRRCGGKNSISDRYRYELAAEFHIVRDFGGGQFRVSA